MSTTNDNAEIIDISSARHGAHVNDVCAEPVSPTEELSRVAQDLRLLTPAVHAIADGDPPVDPEEFAFAIYRIAERIDATAKLVASETKAVRS
jgi:hypothetical protein